MNRLPVAALMALALALALGCGSARAECKLQQLANIPIVFVNDRPMVEATINGKPALLRFSLGRRIWIWGSALKDYDLKRDQPIENTPGFGQSSAALVRELVAGGSALSNAHFDVALSMKKEGEAGLYGSSLFNSTNDIELDFAHNAVRVFKPDDCKGDDVVYWGGAYSVVEQNRDSWLSLKLSGHVVNGTVSPGNEVTFVIADEAHRSGVSLQRAGSLPVAMLEQGFPKPVEIFIGTFREIAIGDETIKNVPLAVGDVLPFSHTWNGPDIVLGADFVKAHRTYFASSQRKMYFSYGGGPAFRDVYARLGVQPPPPQTPKP